MHNDAYTHIWYTVKPSIAAICEFLKAFGQVVGVSLLVHGAWLKSVTVSQHAFCIEHTSMTSRLESVSQAKFMAKSYSTGKEKHTQTHLQIGMQRQPQVLCFLLSSKNSYSPHHLSPFCFSSSFPPDLMGNRLHASTVSGQLFVS